MGIDIQKMRLFAGLLAVALTCATLTGCTTENGNSNNQTEQASLAMFRGDLQHSGMYVNQGPNQLKGVKWKYKTEGPVRSSPVILDGTLYVGSDDQSLYAIEVATGSKKWSFKTNGPIKSSPAVVDGTVFIYSDDGSIYALHTSDGTLKWQYNTEGKDDYRDPVDYWKSSPAIDNGVMYIGGGNNMFYAIEINKGSLLWKKPANLNGYECESCPPPFLHSSPAVYDGVVFVGIGGYDLSKMAEPGTVIAFDAKTGEQKWISDLLIGSVDTSPVVDERAIYIGMRNGGLQALDRKTGKSLWESSTIPFILASPALDQRTNTLYSGSSDVHVLVAFDSETGEMKWTYKARGPIHSSPATDGKTVFFAGGNHSSDENLGMIYAIDASTGEESWTFQSGGNIYSSPTLADGNLFIGSDDGNVYAIE